MTLSAVSFLVPCKNESKFLPEMCESLLMNSDGNWEVIFVDDHSTDGTLQVLEEISKQEPRIKFFENPGWGKIDALNKAYTVASEPIIKLIDADDLVSQDLVAQLIAWHKIYQAIYHPLELIDENAATIRNYLPGDRVRALSHAKIVANLVSIPKACWSFDREIADKVFPIPTTMPYEDVWITFRLTKEQPNIGYCPSALYKYRQHGSMTYGPMDSFSKPLVVYRAERNQKLIDALAERPEFAEHRRALQTLRQDQLFLSAKISLMKYVLNGEKRLTMLKNIIIRTAPRTASWLKRHSR